MAPSRASSRIRAGLGDALRRHTCQEAEDRGSHDIQSPLFSESQQNSPVPREGIALHEENAAWIGLGL
jgi:hypothetical protein